MGGTRLKVEREEKKKKRKKKKEMVFDVKLAVMLIHASYDHVKNIVIFQMRSGKLFLMPKQPCRLQ
jgi:hypothetical protein